MFLIWNIVFGFSVCLGNLRQNNFCIKSGKTMTRSSSALINTVAVDFVIECAAVCVSNLKCFYGVYSPNEKTCKLYLAHTAVLSESLTDTVISSRRKGKLRSNYNKQIAHGIQS